MVFKIFLKVLHFQTLSNLPKFNVPIEIFGEKFEIPTGILQLIIILSIHTSQVLR